MNLLFMILQWNEMGEDFAAEFLEVENLIIVVAYSISNSETEGFANIKEATDKAIPKWI